MSIEENKAIVRRFIEAYNEQNLDAFDDLVSPDYVGHILQIRGLESLKQNWASFFKGFPDTHSTIEDIIAEGDKVCLRYKGTGTHTGEYQGLAPTGKKFKTISVEIYRVVNGKIVEGWTILDWFTHLDFNKQQGVIDFKGYPKEGIFSPKEVR
jgi:predicted ester cyclase